jgi:UDP-2,3-diacylglucosamine hydrolase
MYFASDFHLGAPNSTNSREREKRIVAWLDDCRSDAAALFLVGDIFDFWMEYRNVVPKGFVRLLGRLAEWSDAGIPIVLFTGNHDLWMRDYFTSELGAQVYKQPIRATLGDVGFFIGHGDGLGPGDYGYKRLKKVFTNPFLQWAFRNLVHPDWGVALASKLSKRSRAAQGYHETFLGEDNEWLYQYALRLQLRYPDVQHFVFGHRHLCLEMPLPPHGKARYTNLGEWFTGSPHGILDQQGFRLVR